MTCWNAIVEDRFQQPTKGVTPPMKKDTVVELRRPAQGQDLLSTMLRDGAQRLVAQAVQAEFDDFLARVAGERLEDGRAAVVRNGFQPEREILTGLGSVSVRIPKARSQSRRAGSVSLASGAAVRAPREERGRGAAVAVLARRVHRRHAGSPGRAPGPRGGRALGLGGGAASRRPVHHRDLRIRALVGWS